MNLRPVESSTGRNVLGDCRFDERKATPFAIDAFREVTITPVRHCRMVIRTARRMVHMRRTAILLPLLGLAACTSASSKVSLPEETGEVALGVRVVTPSERLDEGLVRVTGRIVPRREASVSARANGNIQEFRGAVGDRVKKGQVMARLDPTNAAIALEQARAARAMAEAAFENAKQGLERARALHQSGGVAQAQLDAAETGYQQAEAA